MIDHSPWTTGSGAENFTQNLFRPSGRREDAKRTVVGFTQRIRREWMMNFVSLHMNQNNQRHGKICHQ